MVPDRKKGEKVVLLIAGGISEDEVKELIEQSGLTHLMRPAVLLPVEPIPKLGSGKSDFSGAKRIALEVCD
ncbi:MAG: hypothetical protein ABW185_18670 [Sedimenticola sp.]